VQDKDGKEWITSLEVEGVLIWRVRSKEPSAADRELGPFVSALRAIAKRERPQNASGALRIAFWIFGPIPRRPAERLKKAEPQ
jgi:hypothetical protein